jgi:predicted Holliday junction resolvase-like endonuclease
MTAIVAGLAGLLLGIAFAVIVLRAAIRREVDAAVEVWLARERDAIRAEALRAGASDLRRRAGETVGSWTAAVPFRREDARFIGHPVTYLVFDGYAAMRAREGKISGITFAALGAADDPDTAMVAECVAAGRVAWQTIRVGAA